MNLSLESVVGHFIQLVNIVARHMVFHGSGPDDSEVLGGGGGVWEGRLSMVHHVAAVVPARLTRHLNLLTPILGSFLSVEQLDWSWNYHVGHHVHL